MTENLVEVTARLLDRTQEAIALARRPSAPTPSASQRLRTVARAATEDLERAHEIAMASARSQADVGSLARLLRVLEACAEVINTSARLAAALDDLAGSPLMAERVLSEHRETMAKTDEAWRAALAEVQAPHRRRRAPADLLVDAGAAQPDTVRPGPTGAVTMRIDDHLAALADATLAVATFPEGAGREVLTTAVQRMRAPRAGAAPEP